MNPKGFVRILVQQTLLSIQAREISARNLQGYARIILPKETLKILASVVTQFFTINTKDLYMCSGFKTLIRTLEETLKILASIFSLL